MLYRETKRTGYFEIIAPAFLYLTFSLLFWSGNAFALKGEVTFDPSPDPRAVGYKLYYGKSSNPFDYVIDLGPHTNYLISDLEPGCIYYFAATAYDQYNNEGDFSATLLVNTPQETLDTDGDGLTDSDELNVYGTDPNQADTDGDGLEDGEELDYWGTLWREDTDGDSVINLLDSDSDNDGYMDGAEVGICDPGDPSSKPIPDSLPTIEMGELQVDHNWRIVTFSKSFMDPVVVAKPLSNNGSAPAVVRIRNVTPDGFEMRIQEWEYLDGPHKMETVSFIAVERGGYTLENGAQLTADTFFASETGSFESIPFQESFETIPIVIAGIVTENESQAVTGRIRNITSSGFEFSMQEQEANNQNHVGETVAVIALEPSFGQIGSIVYEANKTANQVKHNFYNINFAQSFMQPPIFLADMQTCDGGDTANLRWTSKNASTVQVKIAEEKSRDSEIKHTTEVVGYMAFADLASSVDTATVYENGEDGSISGWTVYDSSPTGAEITNVFDEDRNSRVIQLTGAGTSNGYQLRNDDDSEWSNTSQFVLKWSMKYNESFVVYIDVQTSAGHRFLTYQPVDYDGLGTGEYVDHGLGSESTNGQWHIFVRDLQADLGEAQPGVDILEVNGFLIRGSGRVDGIKLRGSI